MYIAVAQQRLYEVAVAAVWGPLYDDTSHSMYQPPPPLTWLEQVVSAVSGYSADI
jgi:hypothetical protein